MFTLFFFSFSTYLVRQMVTFWSHSLPDNSVHQKHNRTWIARWMGKQIVVASNSSGAIGFYDQGFDTI